MSDYVLEGEKWGGSMFGTAGGVVTWAVDSSVPAALVAQISAAFADWAKYANIAFQQISSTATAKIDFSLSHIDGLDNVLGETSFSYNGGNFREADITFDSSEGWHTSGSKVISSDGTNFFVVALHEIGHSLGLDHYNDALAVMNSYLSSSVTDLLRSDIDGIRAIYGAATGTAVATPGSAFGTTVHDASSAGGQVYALYEALLGRAPDPLGLEHYADAASSGMSVGDLALSLLKSPEHTAAHGQYDQLSTSDYVEQLYETILGRTGEGAGRSSWEQAIANGESRGDVATAFALSSEHVSVLQAAFSVGVFVPDQDAADAARLYYGILGRAPDAGGLASWQANLRGGESLHDATQTFLNSSEFQSKGNLSDAAFVDNLYVGALGRHAEASGLQSWVSAIQHGESRADVAATISESDEAHQHLVSAIETGWHLA